MAPASCAHTLPNFERRRNHLGLNEHQSQRGSRASAKGSRSTLSPRYWLTGVVEPAVRPVESDRRTTIWCGPALCGRTDVPVARILTKIVVTLGALGVAATRLIWPSLGIDLVAVALLVLAAIPWLDGIFESLETPLWGVKYRRLESRVEALASATASTRLIAETNEARDLARQDAGGRSDPASLVEPAETYEATRKSMKPGEARTDEMTTVVGRMVAAVERGADVDILQFLADPVGGRRLAAYVRLYVKPDGTYVLPLVNAVVDEEKPFGQYWALRSLSRVVDATPDLMDRNTLRRLTRLNQQLPASSDRRYELGRVLARYE